MNRNDFRKTAVWNDFAGTVPWIAGMVCFLNAIFAVHVRLDTLLILIVVVNLTKQILLKRPALLLAALLMVQALIASVLNRAMEFGNQVMALSWGPLAELPGMALLQQSGVGNWPVIKPCGKSIFDVMTYYGGMNPNLNDPILANVLLVIVCFILLGLLKGTVGEKAAGAFVLLPLYYGVFYHVPVVNSLSMFFVYGVVSKVVQNKRHVQGHQKSGMWALALSMLLVLGALSLQSVLPFERLEKKTQDWLPDLVDGSTSQPVVNWPYEPLKTRLGGPIKSMGNAVVFKIEASEAPLYLRGTVKTQYNGTHWSGSISESKISSDSAYDLQGIASNQLPSGKSLNRMDIEKIGVTGDIIFSPLGFWKSSAKLPVETLADGIHRYRLGWFQKQENKYSVLYTGEDQRLEDQELYLAVPDLPKLKTLTREVITGSVSDEDKLQHILQFLKENYRYKLDVPVPPANRDFVSYFLFENKAGYCTYFASAMTLMAREAGLPSRYVEGYLLSPLKYQKGSYYVTEDLAHAWSEVYVANKGWITVESTPAYDFSTTHSSSVEVVKSQVSEKGISAYTTKVHGKDLVQNQPNVSVAWVQGLFALLMTTLVLYALATLGATKWMYHNKTRLGYLRRLYYFEYLAEKSFEGDWNCLGVHQKMARYFLIETEASLLVFDDIIITAGCLLYGAKLPVAMELERLDQFLQKFEKHYSRKITRVLTMLIFLKGWTSVGTTRKGTTT